jgi:hypothetical protein
VAQLDIEIRELTTADIAQIGDRLPLHRLATREAYLVAWDGAEPVEDAHKRLGYRNASVEPQRVNAVIELRGRAVHVTDTLIYLVKDL